MKVKRWHLKFTKKDLTPPYGNSSTKYPMPTKKKLWNGEETPVCSKWTPAVDSVLLCRRGWHAALDLENAKQFSRNYRRTFVVEGRGTVDQDGHKIAYAQMRFILEVTPEMWQTFAESITNKRSLSRLDMREVIRALVSRDYAEMLVRESVATAFKKFIDKKIEEVVERPEKKTH